MSAECIFKQGKRPTRKVPLTDEDHFEMELLQEAELCRARRQHRILERDRTALSSGTKIVKQRRVINILSGENNNILTNLFVASSKRKKLIDSHIVSGLHDLLDEKNTIDEQIKEKRSSLDELDYQMKQVEKAVIGIRSKLPTDVNYQDRVVAGQKTVETLENKLETANKRFCVILTDNDELRDKIKHLLSERINFNIVWEKLVGNLSKGKTMMMDLIEQSTIAYNQREEWCGKLLALRSRAHSDLIVHTQQMHQLQRIINHESKLEQFLIIKGSQRTMKSLESKELLKQKEKRGKMREQLQNQKETLAGILDFTGISTIPGLISEFYRRENENFALFEYIVGLHTEIESLTSGLVCLHNEIDETYIIRSEWATRQQSNLIKAKDELKRIVEEANAVQASVEVNNGKLKVLIAGINKLCTLCKCKSTPLLQLLGCDVQMNQHNVLLHLRILENRIDELIMEVYYNNKTKSPLKRGKQDPLIIDETKVAPSIHEITQIIPTNPCPLCTEQEQINDVIDSLQFVQTKDEIKQNLGQRMQLPGLLDRLHNVSVCHIPKSRQIIQRRYQ